MFCVQGIVVCGHCKVGEEILSGRECLRTTDIQYVIIPLTLVCANLRSLIPDLYPTLCFVIGDLRYLQCPMLYLMISRTEDTIL